MSVTTNKHIGMFPGHRNHFVMPGYSDMDPYYFQFGKVTGYCIQTNWTTRTFFGALGE